MGSQHEPSVIPFFKITKLFKVDGKKEILVAYCYDDKIGVYDIQKNGDLRFNREIQSSPTMDNFWKAPDGSIYLAGSSHAWRFFWNKIFAGSSPHVRN